MDEHFFDVLLSSYLWSLLIILPIAYGFIKYAVYITNIPDLKFIFGPSYASAYLVMYTIHRFNG